MYMYGWTPLLFTWNYHNVGFPGGSDGKESACRAEDQGSTPGSGRSPGRGNGNPLQYSCLENSIDGLHTSTRLQRVGRDRATNAHTTKLLISYNPKQNKKLKVWREKKVVLKLVVFLSYYKWLFNCKSGWRNRHYILNYRTLHLFNSIPKLLSPSKEETLLRLVNRSWESTSPP